MQLKQTFTLLLLIARKVLWNYHVISIDYDFTWYKKHFCVSHLSVLSKRKRKKERNFIWVSSTTGAIIGDTVNWNQWINVNQIKCFFEEWGKPEYPEKYLSMQSLGIEPGPHWWESSALTTAPSLHPKRMKQWLNILLLMTLSANTQLICLPKISRVLFMNA